MSVNAKEYLMQIRRLDDQIKSNRRRIEELESDIAGIRAIDYSGVRVQSTKGDALADSVARLYDMKCELAVQTVELQEKKNKILQEIRQIPDTDCVDLLTYRYVDCDRWEDVEAKMNRTVRQLHRIQKRAYEEFEKLSITE